MSKATHPPPVKQRHTATPTPYSRATLSAPRNPPGGLTTGGKPFIKKIENPAERERLRREGKCLRCRRPNCPGASGDLGLAQHSQKTVPLGIATEVTYRYEIMLKTLALSRMKRAPLRTPLSR